VATAWALLDMRERGMAPLGLIFQTTNPIIVQGAALAGLAILHRLEPDPLSVIETGDYLRMDPSRGVVEVEKGASGAGQDDRGPDARAQRIRAQR
jgi:predicted aconitase with swiveling domain